MEKKSCFIIVCFVATVLVWFTGCSKEVVADFECPESAYVDEYFYVTNYSLNAYDYIWEYGDNLRISTSDSYEEALAVVNASAFDNIVGSSGDEYGYYWGYTPSGGISFENAGEKKIMLHAYSKNGKKSSHKVKYIRILERTTGDSGSGSGSDIDSGSGSGSGSDSGNTSEYTSFRVTNAHGYPYSITQIRNGVTVETYSIAANATKTIQSKCGTTEKFTIRQTSGYFEYPNTVNVNPTVINCSSTYSFIIRCSDSYIVCTNYDNSNQYYVDITCPDNGTNTRLVIDGYSKDSLSVDSGFSYTVKFTQKNGYAFSPSTKTYTVNADCGYIYTRSAPDNMKGNDAGNSDVRLPEAAFGRMEIYE